LARPVQGGGEDHLVARSKCVGAVGWLRPVEAGANRTAGSNRQPHADQMRRLRR
jgi:hypothetical protein